jgi:hypothetical protein
VITSDHYLINILLLEIFQEYGATIKKDNDNHYMFWQNGLVIDKDNQLLLIKYDRENMRLLFYGDQQGNNHSLQREVVEFVLQVTQRDQTILKREVISEEVSNQENGNRLDEKFLEKRNYLQHGWHSDTLTISVSTNGKYYVEINKLYEHVQDKLYVIKGVSLYDEQDVKVFSVFNFNTYLPERSKGKMKKVVISYSKDDLGLVNEFVKVLHSIKDDGLIEDHWYCSELLGGSEWNKEIQDKFNEADIIFFMVSPNFLSTKYIKEHELKSAIERKNKEITNGKSVADQLKIIPIILDFCHWEREDEKYNLAQYTALPYRAKPVRDFRNRNMAWNVIEGCIRAAIKHDMDKDYKKKLPDTLQQIFVRMVEGKVDNNSD